MATRTIGMIVSPCFQCGTVYNQVLTYPLKNISDCTSNVAFHTACAAVVMANTYLQAQRRYNAREWWNCHFLTFDNATVWQRNTVRVVVLSPSLFEGWFVGPSFVIDGNQVNCLCFEKANLRLSRQYFLTAYQKYWLA